MSRGLGRIQRGILEVLQYGQKETIALAGIIYAVAPGEDVTEAQHAAVRRALKTLQRAGKVEQLFIGHMGRAYWATLEKAKAYREEVARVFGSHRS